MSPTQSGSAIAGHVPTRTDPTIWVKHGLAQVLGRRPGAMWEPGNSQCPMPPHWDPQCPMVHMEPWVSAGQIIGTPADPCLHVKHRAEQDLEHPQHGGTAHWEFPGSSTSWGCVSFSRESLGLPAYGDTPLGTPVYISRSEESPRFPVS